MPKRLILAAAVATGWLLGYLVNGNIRYQVGVVRVSGYSAAETFSHRPIAFRLLSDAQAWLPELVAKLVGPPLSWWSVWTFEAGFRLIAAGLAAGAALLLWFGLRRRWRSRSWPFALAAYAALVFTAPATGEPDWMAALFAVAAVGVGLPGFSVAGGVFAGVLLAVAALVKISTLPVAVAALIVLWAIDRRRGWIAALSALVTGLVSIGLIWLLAPYEISWLIDIRALQPNPWDGEHLGMAGQYLANLAARWPTVALLPAFFVGARRSEIWVGLAGTALTAFAFIFQGQYYLYHSMGFVVFSALLAVVTIQRSTGALRWPLVALAAWTLVLFMLDPQWRLEHSPVTYSITGAWIIGLAAWQWFALRQARPLTRKATDWWAAALVMLALLVTQTPISAESLDLGTARRTSLTDHQSLRSDLAVAERVHRLIGADTQVAYLVFGATTYVMGNPTHCRYPSALFLQRGGADVKVSKAARQENLECLTDPAARWLIWDRYWRHRKKAPADLLAVIDRNFDCRDGEVIGSYTLCPRRL